MISSVLVKMIKMVSNYLQVTFVMPNSPSPSHLPNVVVRRPHIASRAFSVCNIATGLRGGAKCTKCPKSFDQDCIEQALKKPSDFGFLLITFVLNKIFLSDLETIYI